MKGYQKRVFPNREKTSLIKKIKDIFRILMDSGYYEGTKYAQYFNQLGPDGKSNIYVHDPYEEKLSIFVDDESNRLNYLVGLTGMGKTTLIRNYFRINDRDIKVVDDKDNDIMYN